MADAITASCASMASRGNFSMLLIWNPALSSRKIGFKPNRKKARVKLNHREISSAIVGSLSEEAASRTLFSKCKSKCKIKTAIFLAEARHIEAIEPAALRMVEYERKALSRLRFFEIIRLVFICLSHHHHRGRAKPGLTGQLTRSIP